MRQMYARPVGILAAVVMALAVGSGEARASLIGLSVDGTLSAIPTYSTVSQPFTSPSVVGAAVEFQGQVADTGFDDLFNVSADFTSDALFLTVTYLGPWDSGIEDNLFNVSFVFGGSPQIGGFSWDPSSSAPGGVSSTAFTASTLTVGFTDLVRIARYEAQTWEFSIETGQSPPIPEPASLLLLGTGLAGMIAAQRRRA